jgi:hypothetical protein
MRVAGLILAHHEPESLERIITDCLSNHIDVYIHLDIKFHLHQGFISKFGEYQAKIHFVRNRFDCKWGDLSLVQATFELLDFSLKEQYDYFLILSGEDKMVSANILSELVELNGNSMFNHWILPFTSWWGGGMFRIDRPHFFDNKKRRNLNFKLHQYLGGLFHRYAPQVRLASYFPDMVFYGGQQWMVLSIDAVSYLTQFVNEYPKIWDVFKYSFAPDELFIQTILCNNKSLKIVNRPTHYVRFKGFDSSPDYLTAAEIDFLKTKGEFLFARKYEG